MNEKIYYSAEDIAKMLGVSMGKVNCTPCQGHFELV